MLLSTIFQLYHGSQFYWWGNTGYTEKTTDHPQVTDKTFHTMLHRVHFTILDCTLNEETRLNINIAVSSETFL